jgi:hypothetical protein
MTQVGPAFIQGIRGPAFLRDETTFVQERNQDPKTTFTCVIFISRSHGARYNSRGALHL